MKKIIAWTVAAAAVLAVGGIIAWSFSVSGNERAAKVKVRGNGATTQLTSSPDATVRSEQVGYFDHLEVTGPFDVTYTKDGSSVVTLRGHKADLDCVAIQCRDSHLTITLPGNRNGKSKTERIAVELSSQALRELDVTAGASFTAEDVVSTDEISINGKSSAKVNIGRIICRNFEADAQSSANIELRTINADECDLSAESSGHLFASAVKAAKIEADAESSASVEVDMMEGDTFNSDVESSGAVAVKNFTGKLVKAEVESSGALRVQGTVYRVNLQAESAGEIDASQLSAEYATVRCASGGKIKYNAVSGDYNNSKSARNYYTTKK